MPDSGRVLQCKTRPVCNIVKLAVQFPLQRSGLPHSTWLLTSTAQTLRQRWPQAMQTESLTEGSILHAQAVGSGNKMGPAASSPSIDLFRNMSRRYSVLAFVRLLGWARRPLCRYCGSPASHPAGLGSKARYDGVCNGSGWRCR
jgi:hypothetical protein